METILRIAFNNFSEEIIIKKPPYIPMNGELFSCDWKNFTNDKELLIQLNAIEENESWMVNRFSCRYSKEKVECLIILYTTVDYEKYFSC